MELIAAPIRLLYTRCGGNDSIGSTDLKRRTVITHQEIVYFIVVADATVGITTVRFEQTDAGRRVLVDYRVERYVLESDLGWK